MMEIPFEMDEIVPDEGWMENEKSVRKGIQDIWMNAMGTSNSRDACLLCLSVVCVLFFLAAEKM